MLKVCVSIFNSSLDDSQDRLFTKTKHPSKHRRNQTLFMSSNENSLERENDEMTQKVIEILYRHNDRGDPHSKSFSNMSLSFTYREVNDPAKSGKSAVHRRFLRGHRVLGSQN